MTEQEAQTIERIQWVASSFNDSGRDWNKFHLFDSNNQFLKTITVDGY